MRPVTSVRASLRVLSNWPEVRRPINAEAVGCYNGEVGAAQVPDDLNVYEWQQAQAENGWRITG